jgi:hypothetical protein
MAMIDPARQSGQVIAWLRRDRSYGGVSPAHTECNIGGEAEYHLLQVDTQALLSDSNITNIPGVRLA